MELKILQNLNEDIIAIRTEAFVAQRNVPKEIELDGRDSELLHFCLYEGDTLLSYLRAEGIDDVIHVGRVTTATLERGKGYGRQLMEALCEYAKTQGFRFVELNAVDTAVGFYEKLGFIPEGDYFLETGVPHIYMKKELSV